MALLYMDSFDHYVSGDMVQKWTEISGGGISAGQGRRGTASAGMGFLTAISKNLPFAAGQPIIVGTAFRPGMISGGPTGILHVWNSVARRCHVVVSVDADGALAVWRMTVGGGPLIWSGTSAYWPSAVLLGRTAAGLIASNAYAHVQLKVLVHDTAGSVELRVNGSPTPALSVTGVNTQNTANPPNAIVLESGGDSGFAYSVHFDDLYVLDGSGPAPWNDYLGDCRCDVRYPNGAGSSTGWTPLTGANWSNVDEPTPNGDTDYCSAEAQGVTDLHSMQDAPVPGVPVYGVQVNVSLRKADVGFCETAPVIRADGTTHVGTPRSLFSTYNYQTHLWPNNPTTGNPWTTVEFDAVEVGYTRTQ